MAHPVKVDKLVITQPFKLGEHNGVDLRTVSFITWKKLPIVTTEEMMLLRQGVDGYGNDFFVLRPRRHKQFDEIKYIHVKPSNGFLELELIEEGGLLGYSAIDTDYKPRRGNSKAHHLHFEVWRGNEPINPVLYLDVIGARYVYK